MGRLLNKYLSLATLKLMILKIDKHIIIAINIAALMVLMDLSAINIALPSIKSHFNLSVSQVSFILMASMLSATGSALIMGKFIENYDPRKILLFAFTIFGTTTSLSALATDFYTILSLRFLQGIAEAALYVIGPALIKQYVVTSDQQHQYGIWMMSCGLGISLGPIIGGLLIKYFAWNMVFLINLPLAILGIIYSWKMTVKTVIRREKNSFDYTGALYSFLFISLFILSFKLASIYNLVYFGTVSTALLSILFLYLFIRQEKKTPHPIINLKLFSINNFRLANLGFFLFFFINVGSRFLRPFYFEEARGLSSSTSGLLMMISPVIMLVVSYFIPHFKKHFSTKKLIIIANVLLSISMLMFAFWNSDSLIIFLVLSMIILGVSMGIYYPTTTQLGMQTLPNNAHGTGSAVMSISKSLGKLMGVLLFALLFQSFFQFINDKHLLSLELNAKAIQYVFMSAFIVSIINIGFSLKIND